MRQPPSSCLRSSLANFWRVHDRSVRRFSACLALFVTCRLPLAAQNHWQQQVNYTIDVSFNATEYTLDGFARIRYINNSPDTLSFIWFHLWPNAYKNDETAFSEQLLGNGRTDFYFSDKEQKGYINRLDFRENGVVAGTEDHPLYIDMVKVILPKPLPPGGEAEITTPFHEKLPFDLSRGGYSGRYAGGYSGRYSGGACRVTDWYPQPAVYDHYGWHPIPYLDQGGSYNEFGNFDVRITLPKAYAVAATGELTATDPSGQPGTASPSAAFPAPGSPASSPSPSPDNRTLRYRQENIQDFAWFAAKNYKVDHDTLQLASGRIIDLYAYYPPASATLWKDGIQNMKYALRFRSGLIGEYPFATLSAVGVDAGSSEAAEYPGLITLPLSARRTITMISPATHTHARYTYKILLPETVDSFRKAINHEVGQQWFSSIIGANERRYLWMGEGFAAYYDRISPHTGEWWSADDYTSAKMAADPQRLSIDVLAAQKKDQPIMTSSEDFSAYNYSLIPRYKTALWLEQLRRALGQELFDSCMRQYFRIWQFRHPYPEDLRAVFETTSHWQLDSLFGLLDKTGPLIPFRAHKTIKAAAVYSRRNTDKFNYINIGPAVGYNHYDQVMIGAYFHNLDLPPNRFQFLAAPLYATNSNRLNGLGGLSYSWYPDDAPGGRTGDPASNRSNSSAGSYSNSPFRRILVGITGAKFSTIAGVDSNGNKTFGGFYKIVPTVRLTLRKPSARSTLERWIEWKTYLIGEKGFDNYVLKTTDSMYYPVTGKYDFRYLNQLGFYTEDQRVLYPYNALLQFQQGSSFYRVNFTGNYFFNYERGGGMAVRLFAAKFGYIGGMNPANDLTAFEPKLTGVRGNEDYTYSNYFVGRNEFTGFASQQIMMRDGDLKIRTDLFQDLQGRSDNWVAALNLSSSLPPGLLPPWLPLKVFLDAGTYAEAWQNNAPTSHFLYVGGLQLSLLRNTVTFYAPLIYSSDFGNQLKTVPDENSFFKKISFSINFRPLDLGLNLSKKGIDNPF